MCLGQKQQYDNFSKTRKKENLKLMRFKNL